MSRDLETKNIFAFPREHSFKTKTVRYDRKFQNDINEFIRLNRTSYHYPQIRSNQRVFTIAGGMRANNYVGNYGDFAYTYTVACQRIYELRDIPPKSVVIVSNHRVMLRCRLHLHASGVTEYDRISRDPKFKAWVVDDDYKDVLIFNFGDCEVRTGVLAGLDAPLRMGGISEVDKELTKLSKDYPHYCQDCKKRITLGELVRANKDKDPEWLKELWVRKDVEFFCCSCVTKQNGKWGF